MSRYYYRSNGENEKRTKHVGEPQTRFNNILEPETGFVPFGAQPRNPDRFPIGGSTCPISGDGPDCVNIQARALIFSYLPLSGLKKCRGVCKEWKKEIEELISKYD